MATLTLKIPTPSATTLTPEAADALVRLAEFVVDDVYDEMDRCLAPFLESWSLLAEAGAPDAQAGFAALITQVGTRVALRGLAQWDREPGLPTWRVPEGDAHHARWAELAQGLHDSFPGGFFVSFGGDESATDEADDDDGTIDPWPDDSGLPEESDVPEAPDRTNGGSRMPDIEIVRDRGFVGIRATFLIPEWVPNWVIETVLVAAAGALVGGIAAGILAAIGPLAGTPAWMAIGAIAALAVLGYALYHLGKSVWNGLKKLLGRGKTRPDPDAETVEAGSNPEGIIWMPFGGRLLVTAPPRRPVEVHLPPSAISHTPWSMVPTWRPVTP